MSNPGEYLKPEYLDGTTARLAARLPSDEMNKLEQEIMEIVDNHTPEEGAPLVAKTIKDAVFGDVCDWLADHLKGQPQGTTITVALDEEYGYRQWLWETGMTASELEAWWTALPSVRPFSFSPEGLPGTLREIGEDLLDLDKEAERIWNDPTISKEEAKRRVEEMYRDAPYVWVFVETGKEMPPKKDDWWSAHIHMDEDSHLKTSGGRYIHHAGYAKAPHLRVLDGGE